MTQTGEDIVTAAKRRALDAAQGEIEGWDDRAQVMDASQRDVGPLLDEIERLRGQYDSRPDTLIHSQRVGELMVAVAKEVLNRSTCHDRSKTLPPEVDTFNEFTPKLKTSTYGSAEYAEFLAAMGEGLAHHYAENRHHPEHFPSGVNGMTLADLIEMLADWKAATERHDDGSLTRSLEIQRERFGLSDQLVGILRNTAEHFGWLDQ